MSELHDKALALLAAYDEFVSTTPAEDVILDAIRDLLAENERLKSELSAQVQCTVSELTKRQGAEARLKALCEAEPCAYEWFNGGHLRKNIPKDAGAREWNALIPRPSMEDCK